MISTFLSGVIHRQLILAQPLYILLLIDNILGQTCPYDEIIEFFARFGQKNRAAAMRRRPILTIDI